MPAKHYVGGASLNVTQGLDRKVDDQMAIRAGPELDRTGTAAGFAVVQERASNQSACKTWRNSECPPHKGPMEYDCPHCSGAAEVAEEHVGGSVLCPHCSGEFFATSPTLAEPTPPPTERAKVPFFKSSRLRVLRQKLDEPTADGDFSAADARAAFYEAMRLNLSEKGSRIDPCRPQPRPPWRDLTGLFTPPLGMA